MVTRLFGPAATPLTGSFKKGGWKDEGFSVERSARPRHHPPFPSQLTAIQEPSNQHFSIIAG